MSAPAVRALAVCALAAPSLAAQHHHAPPDSSRRVSVGAMATAVYSNVNPGALRQRISEGYLTQPMVVAAARGMDGHVLALVTLNAEGATLDRGEINPGVYGEGYVDRRHPHTWLHEAMAGVRNRTGPVRWALFGGKGFVPYGSDDPMVRPFVKYPVNHHHAQILERALLTATLQWRSGSLEAARFNGDEPEGPSDWPDIARLFDSWAARATVTPRQGLELSASAAGVQSPEFARGDGLDQKKRAAAVRFAAPNGRLRYWLVEVASTREYSGARQAFSFASALAEAEGVVGSVTLAARVERTTRPEEERVRSFYRTIRPLLDFNILGRTRWTTLTASVSHRGWGRGPVVGRPFVEVGYHVPRATLRPTPLDPVEVFGANHIWSLSFGVRMQAGHMRSRFGRYGLDS